MSVYYIDRENSEKKKEIVAGEVFLRWVCDTKAGNSLLETIIKKKMFSTLYGRLQDSRFSKKKIKKFVEDLHIDMSEAKREDVSSYNNFNDFFTRNLKDTARPISIDKDILISPADGRVLAYENIDITKLIQVKGSHYSLEELFHDNELAKKYSQGTCMVVRLCPSDYHRFHFPDSGFPNQSKFLDGHYYSVNPLSLRKIIGVYCQNKREITQFNSDNFGDIAFVEVGATCVGSIIQTYKPNEHVEKGQEKGYFKFGGSTVIMFLEKGIVKIDDDIIENTKNGIETKVNMGEKIGMLK